MRLQLPVTPYAETKGIKVESATLNLTNNDFASSTFRDGTSTLSFFNCRILDLVIENTEDIVFENISIGFFNCFIASIKIKDITSKNISVHFLGSLISGKIESNTLTSVSLNNCASPNGLFLFDLPHINISYSKENITDDPWLAFVKDLHLGLPEELPNAKYHISNPGTFTLTSNFEGGAKMRFTPELNIRYDKDNDVKTRITGLVLPVFAISGKPKGDLSIENTRIDRWYMYNFYPQGSVSFHDIRPMSTKKDEVKIGIHRSVLDKVEFDNVSFDKYPIISFHRTKFSKAIFTSCDFPKTYKTFTFISVENVHLPEKKPTNFDKSQYEIFLQLKKAMDDTGNYYESQKMQAMAHEALRNIKTLSYADKSILCINNASNEHGLSIGRPLAGFFIFSIPLYIFYLWSLNRIFNRNEIDWNLFGYYFSYVDITHRNDFLVKKDELTGWAVLWDYAGKLFVGFFIYQFVAAFRKYGKTK